MGLALSPRSLVPFVAALAAATSAAPASASSHILQSTTNVRIPDDACTFRAYEIQVCKATAGLLPPSTTAYLQINKVFAADGSVAVDVAALRPRQSYNSYQKLDPDEIYEVAMLENDERLTAVLSESEGLKFAYGMREWSVKDEVAEKGSAWCQVREWTDGDEEWTCDSERDGYNRVSQGITQAKCSQRSQRANEE
jgi:hypothetical protein